MRRARISAAVGLRGGQSVPAALRGRHEVTYLRNFIAHVVEARGFIFGELASLQIRMIGICVGLLISQAVSNGSWHVTCLCLLDQNVHGSDTAPVAPGHPVYFVHDKTRPRSYIQASSRIFLLGDFHQLDVTSATETVLLLP